VRRAQVRVLKQLLDPLADIRLSSKELGYLGRDRLTATGAADKLLGRPEGRGRRVAERLLRVLKCDAQA
jgi:hypothetical protein